MEELKPCPFCGGRGKLEESFRAFIGGETTKVAFVHCRDCNARSGRVKIADYNRTSRSQEASAEAVRLWNNRSSHF